MPDALTISIADWAVTLRLEDCDEPTRARIAEQYAAFIVPASSRGVFVHVRTEPGSPYISFENAKTCQIQTQKLNGRMKFKSHLEYGWVDLHAGQGELTLRPAGDTENFLRVLYAWLCLEHGSLLLHSSGVIRNGRGYVFFGPSGSGKTTTARLSLEHTILSDDMTIVKKVDDHYRVFGVPFRGVFQEAPRTNASADLHGLFSLSKDTQHSVTSLAASQAVARLAGVVPFVMQHPSGIHQVTEICSDLAAHVPVRTLHFRRDDGFWKVIDGLEPVPGTA